MNLLCVSSTSTPFACKVTGLCLLGLFVCTLTMFVPKQDANDNNVLLNGF